MYTEIYMEDHARSKIAGFREQAQIERWYRQLDDHNRQQTVGIELPKWDDVRQVFMNLFGHQSPLTHSN